MKMIRTKAIALIMMIVLACAMIGLVACSDTEADVEEVPEDPITTAVVYYSATGTTQTVADMIAGAVDGVPFAIDPIAPYTDADLDYNDPESRVSQEHEDANRSIDLVMSEMPGWETYDVVFVGYPIWWGEAAWPMQSFVQANSFSGKQVIPFCTSASSGIGASATQLSELTKTGYWLPGTRFSALTTQAEVNDWIASLDLATNAEAEGTLEDGPQD